MSGANVAPLDHGRQKTWVIEVEFAFQYTKDTHTTESMFVNTLETPDGGTHRKGLRTALTRTINKWARQTGYLKTNDINFTGLAVRTGLTAVVSLKHPNPRFQSWNRLTLMNSEVSG